MGVKILLPALIAILLFSCRDVKPERKEITVINVKIAEISDKSFTIPIHSAGILMSEDELKLSFKTGGIIASVRVREGDKVKKGDVLAVLNLSEINAQVSLARTAYDKAMRDYGRANNLYTDSVATLEQLQNALSALSAARSNLEIARFNLRHSEITAPSDGIILKQIARASELVSPGYPIFLFGSSGKSWKVKCTLSDRDLVKVNRGDSASIAFDAWPGIKFQAVVDQIGEIANPSTGTYDVEMLLEDQGYRLASGFIAGVDIFPAGRSEAIIVPVQSVIEPNGQTGYIYLLTDSSTVRKTKIEILTITDDGFGIGGDLVLPVKVVTEGAAYLRNGMKVNVLK